MQTAQDFFIYFLQREQQNIFQECAWVLRCFDTACFASPNTVVRLHRVLCGNIHCVVTQKWDATDVCWPGSISAVFWPLRGLSITCDLCNERLFVLQS